MAVALLVVPGLLSAFHLLSRAPKVTSQPGGVAHGLGPGATRRPADWASSVADEAQDWLRSQSHS